MALKDDVMTYGTVLNEVCSENKKYEYRVRTRTYFYNGVIYFATTINGRLVDFVDTSESQF